MKLKWLGHAGFKLTEGIVVYFDPYKTEETEKADLILISHGHSDHYSPASIKSIFKEDTEIVTTEDAPKEFSIVPIKAGDKLFIKKAEIDAVPAYNINKFREPKVPFHPKGTGIGFVLKINNKRIYFAGDTDFIPEMKNIKADVAIVPIGGVYTMNAEEAVEALKVIRPKIAIPMHYGSIVGTMADAEDFQSKAKAAGIKSVLLKKGEEIEI